MAQTLLPLVAGTLETLTLVTVAPEAVLRLGSDRAAAGRAAWAARAWATLVRTHALAHHERTTAALVHLGGLVYGPGMALDTPLMAWAQAIVQSQPVALPDGAAWPLVYVDDVAVAATTAWQQLLHEDGDCVREHYFAATPAKPAQLLASLEQELGHVVARRPAAPQPPPLPEWWTPDVGTATSALLANLESTPLALGVRRLARWAEQFFQDQQQHASDRAERMRIPQGYAPQVRNQIRKGKLFASRLASFPPLRPTTRSC